MATYAKLLNGLTDLGIHKMQEHLDYYIDLVNKGQKSFSDALEELIDIEKKNNQLRAENACVKTANFPLFLKTVPAQATWPVRPATLFAVFLSSKMYFSRFPHRRK